MFELYDVFWLCIVIVGATYWWSSQGLKQLAFQAAKRHCETMDVMLLDESMVLKAIWFKKDNQNKTRFWRRYHFEFTSTGEDRYEGQVVTLGQAVTHIQLAPHRI